MELWGAGPLPEGQMERRSLPASQFDVLYDNDCWPGGGSVRIGEVGC